jgi:hypothetical protein
MRQSMAQKAVVYFLASESGALGVNVKMFPDNVFA